MIQNLWVWTPERALRPRYWRFLDTFLQINDQINTVLGRYEAFKKGDYTAATNPVPTELAQSSSQATSLIDFDDSLNAANTASSPGGGINDLANLFSAPAPQQPSFTLAGNLGPTNTSRPTSSTITHSPTPVSYNRNGGPLFSAVQNASSLPIQTATPPASIMLPPTPQQKQLQNTTSMPNYFNGLNPAKGPIQYSAMEAMAPQRQVPQPSQSSNSSSQSQGKDPFADLAGLF